MGIQSSIDKIKCNDNSLSTLSSQSNIQIEHLETFILIWFDEKRIDDQNQQLKKRLRQLTTNFIYFDDFRLCRQWLNSRPTDEKILFIVSGRVGQKIVPLIHHLTSIIGIYVFSMILEHTSAWIQPYSKIRATVFTAEDLIQQLLKDQRYFENIEDSKSIQIFKNCPLTKVLDPQYSSIIWYQLLLEILLSPSCFPSSPSPKQFIDFLRQSISNDKESLNLIKEFELTYDNRNPVKWLINNTPIGRFLHKALREQNIEILFYLRFFLIDIYNQLMSNRLSSICVYRKELMSLEKVENLRSNVNNYIMLNNFLITRIEPSNPLLFDNCENGYETVLIEINADYHDGCVPFTKVENDETNVLFMCGSIFQIISFELNENSTWTLKLCLCSKKEFDLLNEKTLDLVEKNQMLMIVELLNEMDESKTKWNILCKELIREFPSNDPVVIYILDKMKNNVKDKGISLSRSQFILIDLTKDNLSLLSFEMLNVLQSLTKESILIVNNYSDINFDEMKEKTIFIFTTSRIHSSIKKENHQPSVIFILEEDKNICDQFQHLNNSKDLIFRLADELSRCYMWEVEYHLKSHEIILSIQKEKIANQIHQQLKEIYKKFPEDNQTSIKNETIIIWLKFDNQNNEIIQKTKDLFDDFVSSFLILDDPQDCYNRVLCMEQMNPSIFLIIDDQYKDITLAALQNDKNIKKIYRYDSIKRKKNIVCLKLIYDLIYHFNQMANQYQNNNDSINAKQTLFKTQNLCELINKI